MHTVGDRSDRHLGPVESRPQVVEHAPADLAVQQRHPVGPLRKSQTHVRHVELRRVVLGTERDHPLQRHTGQQPGVGRTAGRAAEVTP